MQQGSRSAGDVALDVAGRLEPLGRDSHDQMGWLRRHQQPRARNVARTLRRRRSR